MPTNPLRVSEALRWGQQQLKMGRTANLDARVLLADVLGYSTTELLSNLQRTLPASIHKKYKLLIKQRVNGVPVAYLVGEKEFGDITLKVNRNVLIPRPATEAIVEEAIKTAKLQKAKSIYEIGTGSGVIAISIAKKLPKVKIVASDISPKALLVAKENIRRYKLNGQIKLVKSNLGEHIKKPALVVANLPYLPNILRKKNELKFEPSKALFAGETGLELYKKMFADLLFTTAIIELGAKQYPPINKWLKQKYPCADIVPVRDLDKTICGIKIIKS